jgi:hypothetical protein
MYIRLLAFIGSFWLLSCAYAQPTTIAVAANMKDAFSEIA